MKNIRTSMKLMIVSAMTGVALIVTSLVPVDALANFQAGNRSGYGAGYGGGFKGNSPQVMTIKQAEKQPDDAWVTLQGKIVSQVGDELYIFQDASGQGHIEIDDDIWRGLIVNPQDTVEIQVEVDKEWGKTELEVTHIRIIQ